MQQRYGKKYSDYQSLRAEDDSDYPAATSTPTRTVPAVVDIEDFGNIVRRNGVFKKIKYLLSVKFTNYHCFNQFGKDPVVRQLHSLQMLVLMRIYLMKRLPISILPVKQKGIILSKCTSIIFNYT